jgi:hypothetical protein
MGAASARGAEPTVLIPRSGPANPEFGERTERVRQIQRVLPREKQAPHPEKHASRFFAVD